MMCGAISLTLPAAWQLLTHCSTAGTITTPKIFGYNVSAQPKQPLESADKSLGFASSLTSEIFLELACFHIFLIIY